MSDIVNVILSLQSFFKAVNFVISYHSRESIPSCYCTFSKQPPFRLAFILYPGSLLLPLSVLPLHYTTFMIYPSLTLAISFSLSLNASVKFLSRTNRHIFLVSVSVRLDMYVCFIFLAFDIFFRAVITSNISFVCCLPTLFLK